MNSTVIIIDRINQVGDAVIETREGRRLSACLECDLSVRLFIIENTPRSAKMNVGTLTRGCRG
jgi:hypothetical protein